MVKLSQVTVKWYWNSQGMISFMITTRSLNIQNMIKILKQWRRDFSGKHLYIYIYINIYIVCNLHF